MVKFIFWSLETWPPAAPCFLSCTAPLNWCNSRCDVGLNQTLGAPQWSPYAILSAPSIR